MQLRRPTPPHPRRRKKQPGADELPELPEQHPGPDRGREHREGVALVPGPERVADAADLVIDRNSRKQNDVVKK